MLDYALPVWNNTEHRKENNMPYIPKNERSRYDKSIKEIVHLLLDKFPGENGKDFEEGDLNYIISSIVWKLFDAHRSYRKGNTLVGVLECVKMEFVRRRLNDYENKKIETNGDL